MDQAIYVCIKRIMQFSQIDQQETEIKMKTRDVTMVAE